MSCCGTGAELSMLAATDPREILLTSRHIAGNLRQTDLSVPDVHCGACIHTVEKALGELSGVTSARVNLSTRRVTIKWRAERDTPPDFIGRLHDAGYEARPCRSRCGLRRPASKPPATLHFGIVRLLRRLGA